MLLRVRPGTIRPVGTLQYDLKVCVTSEGHKARAFLHTRHDCSSWPPTPWNATFRTTTHPSVRSARNPNPEVLLKECTRLKNALGDKPLPHKLFGIDHQYSANTYVSGAIYTIYNSPLVSAINACLPRNVTILLDAGADPNGIQLKDLDEYSGQKSSVRYI